MIRLDSVGRQHGQQILFTDASAAVNRGEKVGLVGPNGSGKTTIFRMILKEETPDTGSVTVDRGTTIGYFSQDVGEMAGHTVVAMAMAGAGQVADVAQELRELEAAFGDPEKADQMDELVNRYGEAQARFEELGGYALAGQARECCSCARTCSSSTSRPTTSTSSRSSGSRATSRASRAPSS
jgi:ATPase subunit of ABC transporter with duplicated ATPase domains